MNINTIKTSLCYTVITYLCVDNGGHPEAFARPGHGEHGPEEDENGQDEGEE